ncbi:unnamed protein product [Clavelina lepadiformis]|uniref:Cytoskeleton-associated protein 2 C-terminal domain-containing protein n=1 Tax=Clavelina lepadiformis TaxID=159417 RepID=A0ABP0FYV6_CLALP
MDAARLEKLNAYLISKGRPPKQLHQNFVKLNAKNVKQTPLSHEMVNLPQTKTVLKKDLKCVKARINKQTSLCLAKENRPSARSHIKSSCRSIKPSLNKNHDVPKKRITSNLLLKKDMDKKHTPLLKRRSKLNSKSIAQTATSIVAKKLLRRSINTSLCSSAKKAKIQSVLLAQENELIKTPKVVNKSCYTTQSAKLCKKTEKSSLFRSTTPGPKPKKRATLFEKGERLEQLRSWMISKGKDPNKLFGFKPVKTMVTPVNSPARNSPARNNINQSQWPTLRDEDYHDELSVLVKQTMKEAQDCLERGCAVDEVYAELMEFQEKVPIADRHASFWITLALVSDKLDKKSEEVLELYEKAIKKNAEPTQDIKEALRTYISSRIEKKPNCKGNEVQGNIHVGNEQIVIPESIQNECYLPVAQSKPEALPSSCNIIDTKEVFKSALPLSPMVVASPSSSVVKLRMIPKSSPIFKK